AGARGAVLRALVSVAVAGVGLLAPLSRVRATGAALALRRPRGATAGPGDFPLDGALRPQARIPSGRAVPARGCGGGAVRHGGRVQPGAVAAGARPRDGKAGGRPRRSVLPAGAGADQ